MNNDDDRTWFEIVFIGLVVVIAFAIGVVGGAEIAKSDDVLFWLFVGG